MSKTKKSKRNSLNQKNPELSKKSRQSEKKSLKSKEIPAEICDKKSLFCPENLSQNPSEN